MVEDMRTWQWRLEHVEKICEKLDNEKASKKDVEELTEEVNALRRALIIFSLSMVGSGGAFLLGVLALTQNG